MISSISSIAIQNARRIAKRKRASKACASCKLHKGKCSDYRPCARCKTSRTKCEDTPKKRHEESVSASSTGDFTGDLSQPVCSFLLDADCNADPTYDLQGKISSLQLMPVLSMPSNHPYLPAMITPSRILGLEASLLAMVAAARPQNYTDPNRYAATTEFKSNQASNAHLQPRVNNSWQPSHVFGRF